jgi:hypothetical protein
MNYVYLAISKQIKRPNTELVATFSMDHNSQDSCRHHLQLCQALIVSVVVVSSPNAMKGASKCRRLFSARTGVAGAVAAGVLSGTMLSGAIPLAQAAITTCPTA